MQPITDLYIYCKVKRQPIPIVHVREAIRQQIRGDKHLATRLSLWDFAGQELYYSTHHIFMFSHSVYVLVFSLVDAINDRKKQLERIVFWLNSICIHTESQDTAIFLVGTHRNSISSIQRSEVVGYLTEKLNVNSLCDRFVNTPEGMLVFQVENSITLDNDSSFLQMCILKEIEDMMYVCEEFPVPFMNFYKLINERKFQNGGKQTICLYDDVKIRVKHQFSVEEPVFQEMLSFYHKAGEIIYQPDDDHLSKYVIFDPNVLVSLMKILITIPPRNQRSRHLAKSWDMMDKRGLADIKLINHVTKSVGISTQLTLSLLLAYDLVCLIPRESKDDEQLYIVPSILPAYEIDGRYDSMPRWQTFQNDDDVYYFDFGSFLPDVVFWRLLARCMSSPTVLKSSLKRHVYSDIARFSFDGQITYILQLVRHIPMEQNLIKVMVQKAPGIDSKCLLKWLLKQLNIIRRRDFKFMEFTLGMPCPYQSHDEFENAERLHIIELTSRGGKLHDNPKVNLLCEGRSHVLKPYPVSTLGTKIDLKSPGQVSIRLETHISKMPAILYKDICDHLNVDLMAGDWRFLAGELGHTAGQVQIYSQKRNPTGEILQEWSRYNHATVNNLLEILQRPSLERYDIVDTIREHISQAP
ncbi:probable serine/threonine-protein kinase roco4 [Ptychodera flava]|uniref:probable serine/threonine-protein kinase roco4 n=1 Tax=Ptychodera flava TaxID=63121 RepID=UPI00396A4309